VAQGLDRTEVATLDHSPYQDAEPNLDLIEPGRMLGHVDKLYPVARLAQKSGPAGYRLHYSRLAFLTQFVAKPTVCCNQAYQAFRLMGVQLVGHEEPDRIRVGSHRLADMSDKVGFRAPWAETGCHDLATHDIEIGNQAECAVTLVFKLAAFRKTWLHRFGFGNPFERLDTSHLITTHHVCTQAIEQWCVGIHSTDGLNLLGKANRVSRLGLRVQPVATTMWLESGLALKTARLNGLRCEQRCLV